VSTSGYAFYLLRPGAPLMNKVERQLTAISSMLTQTGKLQLVNVRILYRTTWAWAAATSRAAAH
jgi:hypothetical protein